jgi:L-ribulose-5-phosphate 3-epimerase
MNETNTKQIPLDRRQFIASGAVAVGAAAGIMSASTTTASAAPKRNMIKSLKMGMIGSKDADGKPLSIEDRIGIAKNAGFASVEPGTIYDDNVLDQYTKAIEKHDFNVDAVVCSKHWGKPLTDANPAIYEETMEDVRQTLKTSKALGGDMILLVPAVVNPETRYADAWTRSVERVKILAEDAERMDMTIGIENVWNKFLLSPLEAVAFIEEVDSKRVQFWFDVGNVVQFGYPEDWIRTLGDKIARVDIKDFKRKGNIFSKLQEGDVNWPEVMKAFDEVGYEGYIAAEVRGGDQAYLTEFVSKPMDAFVSM